MLERLTARQKQILAMTVEGMTDKEIGLRLGITWHTVKDTQFKLRNRLGVNNRVQAVVLMLRELREVKGQPGLTT